MAEDKKEVPPQVQANNNSTAVGSIAVGGELSGNINIGGEMHVHYHASQDAPKSTVFEDTISKQDFEPYTILVPEGPVILPASETEGVLLHENPQQEFVMKVYRIGKFLVTNFQYEEFVQKTDRPIPAVMGWDGQKVRDGFEDQPVLGLTWYDALDYCKWLGSLTGRNYSIPSFAQLEKTYQVVHDLEHSESAVHQWTCTLWGEKQKMPDLKYRFPWTEGARNKLDANSQIRRVVCAYEKMPETNLFKLVSRVGRFPTDAGLPGVRHGFRVVLNGG